MAGKHANKSTASKLYVRCLKVLLIAGMTLTESNLTDTLYTTPFEAIKQP